MSIIVNEGAYVTQIGKNVIKIFVNMATEQIAPKCH